MRSDLDWDPNSWRPLAACSRLLPTPMPSGHRSPDCQWSIQLVGLSCDGSRTQWSSSRRMLSFGFSQSRTSGDGQVIGRNEFVASPSLASNNEGGQGRRACAIRCSGRLDALTEQRLASARSTSCGRGTAMKLVPG